MQFSAHAHIMGPMHYAVRILLVSTLIRSIIYIMTFCSCSKSVFKNQYQVYNSRNLLNVLSFDFYWKHCLTGLDTYHRNAWILRNSSLVFHMIMMTSSNGIIFYVAGVCAGNSPVTGEFLAQRPVTRSFDVFFDRRLNKRLSKQSWGWWFETPSRPLWHHCNETMDWPVKSISTLYGNLHSWFYMQLVRLIICI